MSGDSSERPDAPPLAAARSRETEHSPPLTSGGGDLIRSVSEGMRRVGDDLGIHDLSMDATFVSFLRHASRFGVFSFGPITLDLAVVEDAAMRYGVPGDQPLGRDEDEARERFWGLVAEEQRRSGRRAIDELHFLLAFMRLNWGLAGRIIGELGVRPQQVEGAARAGAGRQEGLEKLYTPEEAAEYLGVHVQTVRAWIRSGRLRAHRLVGQRALRVRASDLGSVLEPVDPAELR